MATLAMHLVDEALGGLPVEQGDEPGSLRPAVIPEHKEAAARRERLSTVATEGPRAGRRAGRMAGRAKAEYPLRASYLRASAVAQKTENRRNGANHPHRCPHRSGRSAARLPRPWRARWI